MMGIQEWVHALEVGAGRNYIRLAALFLGLLALTALYDVRRFRNFSTSEAMDVAQLARNISEGKGYVTQTIRPFSIHLIQRERSDRSLPLQSGHPDLVNPPVYPVLLAGWMKIMPMDYFLARGSVVFTKHQPEMLIAFLNQTIFFGVILMTYFTARAMFDSSAGMWAALVVALTELLWQFSVSGLSTMLLILFFLGIVRLLFAVENIEEDADAPVGRFLGAAVGIGACLALGMLTRYSFGLLALPVFLYMAFVLPRYKVLTLGVAIAVFVLSVSPWLVRNFQLSGNFFGIPGYAAVEMTQRFPEQRLQRSLNPDFSRVESFDVVRKTMVNLAEIVRSDLPKVGENWITAFFLVGLLLPFQNPVLSRLRWLVVGSLGVLTVAQAMGRTYLTEESPGLNSENLLILLFPVMVIFGVAVLETLLDTVTFPFPEARPILTGGVVALLSLPLFFALMPPRSSPVAYPPYHPPVIQQTANWLESEDLFMSDVPWAVAWYGRRSCVWTTLNIAPDFYTINDLSKPIKGLYLTQVTTDSRLSAEVLLGADFAWQRFALDAILRTNLPTGFPLKHGRRDYQEAGQLFLTDRNRWGYRTRAGDRPPKTVEHK